MKKIIFVLGFLLFSLILLSNNPESNSDDYRDLNLLHHILPHQIDTMIQNKSMIFYTVGHHGYNWSLIVRDGTNFCAYNGRVTAAEKIVYEQTNDNRFDSIAFFNANNAIFSWGIDSLPIQSVKMKRIRPSGWISIWESLAIINELGETISDFNYNNAIRFSGPDSIVFNDKFNRLALLMYWLASPEVRKFLPDSIIIPYQKNMKRLSNAAELSSGNSKD